MRIISKFRDYYDSGMAMGQDRDVVFVRTKEVIDLDKSKHPHGSYASYSAFKFDGRRDTVNFERSNMRARSFAILFCGCRHVGIKITNTKIPPEGEKLPWQKKIFYDFATFQDFMNECKVKWNDKRHWWFDGLQRHKYQEYFDLNDAPSIKNLEDKMVVNRHSIVLRDKYFNDGVSLGSINAVVINPELKPYEFYRVLGAYDAFQELGMWIGGVLPKDGAMMATVSDKDRLYQHGFDPRYGFRKRP